MGSVRPHRARTGGRASLRSIIAAATAAVVVTAGLVPFPGLAVPEASAADPTPDAYLVSRADAGTSDQSALSSDGQHVVFRSTEALVAADTNGLPDIYLASAIPGSEDPFAGEPELVSVRADGAGAGNAASSEPAVSADGRFVVFTSAATTLTTDAATSGRRHVYVRDTVLNTTVRIQNGATEPDGDSWEPDISSNGARIVLTSRASNLVADDTDTAADVFFVDRDADRDGAFTSVTIRDATKQSSLDLGDPSISGNGETALYRSVDNDPTDTRPGGSLYIADFDSLGADGLDSTLGRVGFGASAIDDTGRLIAAVLYSWCGAESVVAFTTDGPVTGGVIVGGDPLVDQDLGHITEVAISGDGKRVAWSSTQPIAAAGAAPLEQPVIRVDEPYWTAAVGAQGVDCDPPVRLDRLELGTGTSPSLSASGRSVAFSGPASERPGASSAVLDVDTHSNTDGIAVATAQADVPAPAYVIEADSDDIPASGVHDFGGAFANAPIHNLPIHNLPIHNLPIHNLPIHNLPIHNLPIHNLPIHNLDLPGGWADVLAGTPFEGRSELEITLAEVLDWADATRSDPAATPEQLAAVARIDALTLDSVDIEGTGIDALGLGAIMLGDTPVASVRLPGEDPGTTPWQRLVETQGLGVTVGGETTLAELDWAGLDISRTSIDDVSLRSIPRDKTLLDEISADELELSRTILGGVRVDELSDPTAVLPAGAGGTLAQNSDAFLEGATAASLAAVVPESVTFGDLLTALLDRASYPWEQVDPATLDATSIARDVSNFPCGTEASCVSNASFAFSFDPGPGEPVDFPQAIAQLILPAGTRAGTLDESASGPRAAHGQTAVDAGGFEVDRERTRVLLGDMAAGTVLFYRASYAITATLGDGEVRGELIVGTHAASASTAFHRPLDNFDDTTLDPVQGSRPVGTPADALEEGVVYYGWVSPLYKELDDDGVMTEGPAADDDFYRVLAPPPGHRVVVSTNATDGQLSLSLYRPADATTELGIASAGPAPGTATTEQAVGTDGASSTIGSDAGTELPGNVLVDQEVVAGDGTAQVVAAGATGDDLLLRVTSGNGLPSSSMYSLRVQYLEEPASPSCTPWTPPAGAPSGTVIASDPVDDATNTIYILDAGRFDDTWGVGSAAQVVSELRTLDGSGAVGSAPIHGTIVSVGADEGVTAARTALDANPCDMAARAALTKAINTAVTAAIDGHRDQIDAIVIVGGDDILPLAPVAQNTSQFNEQSHAGDLRLASPSGGPADDPCPPLDAVGVDPCATPLYAAAATNHVLTDDPYALATAYRTLGGTLYVPSVAIGRLAEAPGGIAATVDRFLANAGELAADSSLTGGYGAWSDLPQKVTTELAWRSSQNVQLPEPWTATDLTTRLFPAVGDTATVVSVNAHFDETRLLPGVEGAEQGVFSGSDLYVASSPTDADKAKLAGSLLFTIGCHAGNNLPESYYLGATDWVDVFGSAAGFIGNTGYGLANDTTTALSARLLELYARWIGVTSGDAPVSSGGALVQAKRAYLAGLGLYSGYDEKALMEAVYYGLPMYTFRDSTKTPPLPEIPDYLPPEDIGDSLTAASLSLSPEFDQTSAGESTYLTIGGEAPAVVAGEPVLPKTTMQLKQAAPGTKARGALITGLESHTSALTTPLIAEGTAGVGNGVEATRSDIVFPSTFAHLSTQETPDGPVDLLVVTPARVQARVGGTGTVETFDTLDLQVVYGDEASTDDVAPTVVSVDTGDPRGIGVTVDGTGSEVVRVLALIQPEGPGGAWTSYELAPDSEGWWTNLPSDLGPYRRIVQAVDAAGNVGIASNRGLIGVANAPAPELGDTGGEATVAVGEHLLRSIEVTDATVDDRLTATYAVTSGDSTAAAGPAPVAVGVDGVTRVALDHVPTTPGAYAVSLTVCRADACATASFPLTVPEENHAPTTEVSLTPAADVVSPTATLTATATATDADGDAVEVAYRWLRNKQPIADQSGPTLALTGLVVPGDTVTVEATASDGTLTGGAARASVVVAIPPTITANAHTSAGPYPAGSWSRMPVTVEFTCTGEAPVACPAGRTISADTGPGGVTVSGEVTDGSGQTAATSIVVRVDATAPTLYPFVTPDPVVHDKPATATPNAVDFGSGVASQSCDTPSTAVVGLATVDCRATDAAGNTSTASASYRVLPRTPQFCGGLPDRKALPPVNADGSSVFVRISSVPVIFRACDENGRPIGTKGFVTGITPVSSGPLPAKAHVNELPFLQASVTPVYSKLTQTWVGVLSTRGLTPARTYTYRVSLADGTSFTFTFGIR